MKIPLTTIRWKPGWRIIPSLFPPTGLFDRVASAADVDAVIAIESLTNDRLREEAGDLSLVAPEDRIYGPGSSVIMAAFTHISPQGNRFTDGSYGVFYASYNLDTAIAETRYHREKFMRATNERAMKLPMRVYNVDVDAAMHDLRQEKDKSLFHPELYEASQKLARKLRSENSYGIVYSSVRFDGGVNIAAFKPKAMSNCRQERHLLYEWDGSSIIKIRKA